MSDVSSIFDMLTSVESASASVERPVISQTQARTSGLKRFFTGRECPRGHVSERYTANGICILCNNAQAKRWGADNPEGRYAIKSKWRNANVEVARAAEEKWRECNKERTKQTTAARYAARIEEFREKSRAYGRANKALCRSRVKDWFSRNPDKRRLYNATRRGLLRKAEGTFTPKDVAEIRNRQRDRCAYCRSKLNGGGSLDHIVAISKGGSNWPKNLQWVCEGCNSAKCDRDAIEFAQRRGLLL